MSWKDVGTHRPRNHANGASAARSDSIPRTGTSRSTYVPELPEAEDADMLTAMQVDSDVHETTLWAQTVARW